MPDRHKGLDSRIGTFTHGEKRPTGHISQLSSMSELQRTISALEREIRDRQKFLLSKGSFYQAYCTICGSQERHDGTQKPHPLNNIQGCIRDPLSLRRSDVDVKYCRRCGTKMKKADRLEWFVCQRQKEITSIQQVVSRAYEIAQTGTVQQFGAMYLNCGRKLWIWPMDLSVADLYYWIKDLETIEPFLIEIQQQMDPNTPSLLIPVWAGVSRCQECEGQPLVKVLADLDISRDETLTDLKNRLREAKSELRKLGKTKR